MTIKLNNMMRMVNHTILRMNIIMKIKMLRTMMDRIMINKITISRIMIRIRTMINRITMVKIKTTIKIMTGSTINNMKNKNID